MFSQSVQRFVQLLDNQKTGLFDLNNVSEDDLVLCVLESPKNFVFDYNGVRNNITGIENEPKV